MRREFAVVWVAGIPDHDLEIWTNTLKLSDVLANFLEFDRHPEIGLF